jgi:hypothetical protein
VSTGQVHTPLDVHADDESDNDADEDDAEAAADGWRSLAEREDISRGLAKGPTLTEIAARLNRSTQRCRGRCGAIARRAVTARAR